MAEELEFSQHKFLAELGIEAENLGVFNGEKWVGSGPVITTYNPSTGRPIARVKGVRTLICTAILDSTSLP
jgi:aldehyde dehydrogenase family 7 protein A1